MADIATTATRPLADGRIIQSAEGPVGVITINNPARRNALSLEMWEGFGIAYGWDGLRALVSLVGPAWARLLMFTGMRIDGPEALRTGLVERLVPTAEVAETAMGLARTMADNAPLSIQASKQTIAQVMTDPGARDLDLVRRLGAQCVDSENFREGRRAFMEKRRPVFAGR